MQAQVKEWGNRQGIRLSKELEKTFRHKTLEERAAEFDGKLLLDGEYDWGGPVGREVLLDLSIRGYKKTDKLPMSEMINVSDAIQGIFEYI